MEENNYIPFKPGTTDSMKKINYSGFKEITDTDIESGIEIRWAGYSRCTSEYHFSRITKRYLLLLIADGKCYYTPKKGAPILLSAGDIIFFTPYTPQNLKVNKTKSETMDYYGTCFSGKVFDNILTNSKLDHTQTNYIGLDNQLIYLFKQLINSILIRKPQDSINSTALLFRILNIINNRLEEIEKVKEGHTLESRLVKVVQYMNIHYNKNVTIEKFANIAGLSVSHFEKIFKKNYHTSPKKYFINIKINKAKDLFKYSSLNVSEVANSVGFSDSFYFSRLFKEKIGLSPRDYKKTI